MRERRADSKTHTTTQQRNAQTARRGTQAARCFRTARAPTPSLRECCHERAVGAAGKACIHMSMGMSHMHHGRFMQHTQATSCERVGERDEMQEGAGRRKGYIVQGMH